MRARCGSGPGPGVPEAGAGVPWSPLALITRSPAGFPTRTRWTVLPVGTNGPAVGAKGSVLLWTLWWLCWVLPTPGLAVLAVSTLFMGTPPTPRRISWEAEGRPVLEYTDGPALYELRMPDHVPWDPRVATGLLTLLESYPGWLTRRAPEPTP
jgi:hypothetical protein